jgi:hypothetical protein
VGQAEPLTREPIPPIGPDAIEAPVPSGPGPDATEQSLVIARSPTAPRSGLGEPLTSLPPTAISWDVTTMSRDEQIRASRALIQQRMAASARAGQSIPLQARSLPPGPAPRRDAPGRPVSYRPVPDPVLAGRPLAQAAISPLGPALSGVSPSGLPPVSREQAPLLAADPLIGGEAAGTSPTPSTSSGPSAGSVEGREARRLIGQQHGLDLTGVPVERTPSGAADAQRLQAGAFTSDRGVVIPARAGSLESGPGQSLLAHELTHVAQRIRLGSNLPEEYTPAGQVLEAQALAAEMDLTSRAGPGPAVSQPGGAAVELPTVSLQPLGLPGTGWPAGRRAGPAAGGDPGPALPLASPAPGGPDLDALAVSILDRMSALSTPAAPAAPTVFTPQHAPFTSPAASQPLAAVAPAAAVVQRAMEPVVQTVDPVASSEPTPAPAGAGADPSPRPSDQDLNNLSRWLYPLIRYRLKGELREDRERAGLLTDHYGRW